nr:MAG TPA: hypothetical protein [Caudoviricetes sp.]
MANVELPRDAEGREIPLDTEVLYGEDGKEFKVNYYTYSVRQTIPSRKWQVVMMNCIVHDCSDLCIAPPDSWEKLFEDLKAVEDYRKSSFLDSPTCCYTDMVGKSCSKCKFYGGTNCVGKMCADIADRIRKLRGEANE